jgi:hypothetical protein
MPFDSAPVRKLPPEVRVIDEILDLLGPNGEHWVQRTFYSYNRLCLYTAVYVATDSADMKLTVDDVLNRLCRELPLRVKFGRRWIGSRYCMVMFNDKPGRQFSEIKKLLLRARDRALREAH